MLPDITGNVEENVKPNMCLGQVIVKEEDINYKVKRGIRCRVRDKQDSSGKKMVDNIGLSTARALELNFSLLTDLWLHCVYGLLTRKGTGSILTSLTKTTFVCV